MRHPPLIAHRASANDIVEGRVAFRNLDQMTRLGLQPADDMGALLPVSRPDFRKAIVDDVIVLDPEGVLHQLCCRITIVAVNCLAEEVGHGVYSSLKDPWGMTFDWLHSVVSHASAACRNDDSPHSWQLADDIAATFMLWITAGRRLKLQREQRP